jgi:hypothetical protein
MHQFVIFAYLGRLYTRYLWDQQRRHLRNEDQYSVCPIRLERTIAARFKYDCEYEPSYSIRRSIMIHDHFERSILDDIMITLQEDKRDDTPASANYRFWVQDSHKPLTQLDLCSVAQPGCQTSQTHRLIYHSLEFGITHLVSWHCTGGLNLIYGPAYRQSKHGHGRSAL